MKGGRYVRAHGGRPLGLLLWTRCRKCGPCLGRRRNLWAARARDEVERSARTWFATFTLAPSAHNLMEVRASARLREGGTNWRLLPPDERFSEVAQEYAAELTKWLKRVRKNSGARLRYILVAERHKSGRLHFHALIHEVDQWSKVTHAVLTSAWNLGFTKFKLVERDVKACWYVAKYLAKDAASRVRASLRYGSGGDRKQMNAVAIGEWPTKVWPPVEHAPPPSFQNEEENNVSPSKQSENFEVEVTNSATKRGEQDDYLQNDFYRRSKTTGLQAAADRRSADARASYSPLGAGAAAGLLPAAGSPPTPAAVSEAARRAKQASAALQSVQAIAAAFGAPWSSCGSDYAVAAPLARR